MTQALAHALGVQGDGDASCGAYAKPCDDISCTILRDQCDMLTLLRPHILQQRRKAEGGIVDHLERMNTILDDQERSVAVSLGVLSHKINQRHSAPRAAGIS